MKSYAERLLEQLTVAGFSAAGNSDLNSDRIKINLQKQLDNLAIKGIMVDEVSFDMDGNIYVDLSDLNDNYITVAFSYDTDEGAQALIVGDAGDQEALVIDLDPLSPPVLTTQYGEYLNFLDCSWLNKSTLITILTAGDFSIDLKQPTSFNFDAFGNRLGQPAEAFSIESKTESKKLIEAVIYKTVTRGGKRVRLPILRRKKLERLTFRQKMAKHRSEAKFKAGKNRTMSLKIGR